MSQGTASVTRFAEKLLVCLSWLASAGTIAIVGIFLAFLVLRGASSLNAALFFGDVPAWQAITGKIPVWDGIWPACVGTVALVLLSSLMAVPVGIASGVYISEYSPESWRKFFVFSIDLLAGIPSIIMGLFGFAAILLLRKTLLPGANTCLLLSAACIAVLILPYLIRTTQTALEGLPESLRMAGHSLGFRKWQNVVFVLVPAAIRPIISGIILAVGRAAEDTAVILLTGVVANAGVPRALTDKFEALPFNIYYIAAEFRTAEELDRGFGAALVLLALTGMMFLAAYWLGRALHSAWE